MALPNRREDYDCPECGSDLVDCSDADDGSDLFCPDCGYSLGDLESDEDFSDEE